MADRILDYAVGPFGRSVLMAKAPNPTPRGFPCEAGINQPQPCAFTNGGEALLVEIPEADIFDKNFTVWLSSNGHIDEPYEHFDHGALQFIRPEHAAASNGQSTNSTIGMNIRSGPYIVEGTSPPQLGNVVHMTVRNGGDSAQYNQDPYRHYLNAGQKALQPALPNFPVGCPEGVAKWPVHFRFQLHPESHRNRQIQTPPVPRCPTSGDAVPSDQWSDSVQVCFEQVKLGTRMLTVNFRFVEQGEDRGAQVAPVFYDITNTGVVTEDTCTTVFLLLRLIV